VAVEGLPAAFGLVEPEVPEVVEQAPGLRRDLGIDALDVPASGLALL